MGLDYGQMRAIADELAEHAETLQGRWRVEIGAEGPVMMMMSPSNRHEFIGLRVHSQLAAQLAETAPGYVVYPGFDIESPSVGRLRQPDVTVVPEDFEERGGRAIPADQVLLAVEVTSPGNPGNDREKLEDYPAMGVANYLIIDPRNGTIEAHEDPSDGRYRTTRSYIFGDTVRIGPWRIDSSQFRRYVEPGEEE